MKINSLQEEDKISYLIKPIIKSLQDAGGQLTRDEIKDRICENDEDIAEYSLLVNTSKKTGNSYKPFDYKFNWAIKDLSFVDIITYQKRNPVITLTRKGVDINLESFDVKKEVIEPSQIEWKKISENNKSKKTQEDIDEEISNEDTSIEERYNEDFKIRILDAISKMSPKKFEMFSRKLLSKMGVEFTELGTQISNDGGIDGFGYHRDPDDFRTSKVVIQCKRFNGVPVSEPAINQFLGAMSKFQADYGIFITNSRFTKSAKDAALQGQPITLIDGDMLVDLIKRYNVYVKQITTYELEDFYFEDDK